MVDFYTFFWAVVPPILLLFYYQCRVPTAPSFLRLLLFWMIGIISGLVALGLEWVFETQINLIVNWQEIEKTPLGIALRQLIEVAPIEEGCKFIGVILAITYFQRFYKLRPSTVFLFTLAVAFGFTGEENYIYLENNPGLIVDRIISTPVHAMFSAPWGYALGVHQSKSSTIKAWINSVVCHALVNILSSESRYLIFSYSLFPFLLWMFWRLEQLFRTLVSKSPIFLLSCKRKQRYYQYGVILLTLFLGGNSIFGLFILAKTLISLSLPQVFFTHTINFILWHLILSFCSGVLAWLIYRYLQYLYRRRF